MSNRTKPTGKRQTIRTTDKDGSAVVLVPLRRGEIATLDAEDFDALKAVGFSDQWTFNSDSRGNAYVRVALNSVSGNLATVARLIMRPIGGSVVKYHDGNPLNLRRANLYLSGGASKDREAFAVRTAGTPRGEW